MCGVRSVVMFSGYQLSCELAAVSAQWPVEHLKNASQNITTVRTPHSALSRESVSYLVSDWQPTSTMGVDGDTARTSGHQ